MDHAEKVSTRQSTEQRVLAAEAVLANKKRIANLLQSPYFGRFDFIRDDQNRSLAVYVGIHAFFDEDRKENLIYDWRAPIATMFYDYETGKACYEAPSGDITGIIALKRSNGVAELGSRSFPAEKNESSQVISTPGKFSKAPVNRDLTFGEALIRNSFLCCMTCLDHGSAPGGMGIPNKNAP